MKLYRTRQGCIVEHQDRWYSAANFVWDDLLSRDDLAEYLQAYVAKLTGLELESVAGASTTESITQNGPSSFSKQHLIVWSATTARSLFDEMRTGRSQNRSLRY